jgi:arylsulfatase
MPFRRHKTWVHEGGISTPLIAHWPAGIKARGELRTTPAHVVDVVPTILDLIDVEKPTEWQGAAIPPAPGRSLAPALASDVVVERDSLWWLHQGNRAIRHGDWKLVAAKGDPWELYDLQSDRAESHDLAAARPEKAAELAAEWNRQLTEFSNLAAKTAPAEKRPANQAKARRK